MGKVNKNVHDWTVNSKPLLRDLGACREFMTGYSWQNLSWGMYCIEDTTQGFWYFAEKKQICAGFSGANSRKNRPISREKSQNSRNNRPISGDFRGRKVKIRRKIGPFRGILAEKSQFSKDFQGQILRKIGRFHGKFRGETSPRNNQ